MLLLVVGDRCVCKRYIGLELRLESFLPEKWCDTGYMATFRPGVKEEGLLLGAAGVMSFLGRGLGDAARVTVSVVPEHTTASM